MAQNVSSEDRAELQNDVQKKFMAAQEIRVKGNEAFKEGNMQEALRCYHMVLLNLKGLDQSILNAFPATPKPLDAPPEDETKEEKTALDDDLTARVKSTIGLVYTNMAACHVKKENWRRALECAQQALKIDGENKKAKFREAQARIGLGELQAGKKMLQEMQAKQPDSAITALLKQLDLDEKKRTKKSDAEFRGFLGGKTPTPSKAAPKSSAEDKPIQAAPSAGPSTAKITEITDES